MQRITRVFIIMFFALQFLACSHSLPI